MTLDGVLNRREFNKGLLALIGGGILAASVGCGFTQRDGLSEEEREKINELGYQIGDLYESEGKINDDYLVLRKIDDTKKIDAVALVRAGGDDRLATVLLKLQHAYEGNSLRVMTENYLRDNEDPNPVITNNLANALKDVQYTVLDIELKDQRSLEPGTNYMVGYIIFDKHGMANLTNLNAYLDNEAGFSSFRRD